jgi:hypothetical protein
MPKLCYRVTTQQSEESKKMIPAEVQQNRPQLSLSRDVSSETHADELEPALCSVVGCEGYTVTLDDSPLTPESRGWAGDHGTLEGAKVVAVEERPNGLAHLLDAQLFLEPGQIVELTVDRDRRDRFERTHAGCVLVKALLKRRGIPLTMCEIAPGLAWMETDAPVPPIDLDLLAAFAIPFRTKPLRRSRMEVECAGVSVETMDAPLARNSSAVAGAEVRVVAARDGGRSALEVALPDVRGKWWSVNPA